MPPAPPEIAVAIVDYDQMVRTALRRYLGIPIGEADRMPVRLTERSFGNQVSEENGLVLAKTGTASRFFGAEERRDDDVAGH